MYNKIYSTDISGS